MEKNWVDSIRDYERNKKSAVSPSIWEGVKPHIPKKKEQNRWPFFFLFGGIGILSVLGLTLYSSAHTSNAAMQNSNASIIRSVDDHAGSTESLKSNTTTASVSEIGNTIESRETTILSENKLSRSNNQKVIKNLTKKDLPSKATVLSEAKNSEASSLNDGVDQSIVEDLSDENNIRSGQMYELLAPKSVYPLIQKSITLTRPDPSVNCYQFLKKKHLSLYLEPYIGPGLNAFQLSAKSSENNGYANARTNSEKAQLSGLAGIRLAIQYQCLVIKFGVQYQLINEKFTYNKKGDTKIIQVYDSNDILIRIDTFLGHRIVEHHNYRHLMNIPISLGVIKHYKHFDLGASVGTGINIIAQHRGQYLGASLTPTKYNNIVANTNQGFKQSLGGFVTLDINVSKKLFKRTELFIEPGLIYYLNSFTLATDPLKQNYFSPHIKFGLKMPLLF